MFQQSMDEEDPSTSASAKPVWTKPTLEAVKAQRDAEELVAADPSVFQYDEVIDDVKAEREQEGGSQQIRTDVLTQKKRTGLTVPKGAQDVMSGTKRSAKYIDKVLTATDRRKVEQQIIEDRALKKEKDARKDCEVFVTPAFTEELKRRKKFVEELEKQEVMDDIKAAEKQEHGKGFADMYRNLLNGGLASSRGGEKVREKAAPRTDDFKEEEEEEVAKKEEQLQEAKDEKMAESKTIKEDEDAAAPNHGVMDLPPLPPTEQDKIAEQEKREEKAMSAKERFLARKKAAAAAAAASGD